MIFVLACASSTAFATYDVNNSTNAKNTIESINTSDVTINFDPTGNYSNFNVTVNSSAQNLTLNGNGATLNGDGTNHIFVIDNAIGITINNFIINCNGQNGIRGNSTNGVTITGCFISNGSTGINFFGASQGATITGNNINNMTNANGGFGNGIALINHDPFSGTTGAIVSPSTIEGNNIHDVVFGIFIGGNFQGTITGNSITGASNYGIQFVGRHNIANGIVNATITNNIINSTNIGIAFDTPTYTYLNLTNNTIQGDNSVVKVNSNDLNFNLTGPFIVVNNYFFGGEGDLDSLHEIASLWDNNTNETS